MTHLENYVLETIDNRKRFKDCLGMMTDPYHKLAIVLYLMGWSMTEIASGFTDTGRTMSKQGIQYIINEFKRRNGISVK